MDPMRETCCRTIPKKTSLNSDSGFVRTISGTDQREENSMRLTSIFTKLFFIGMAVLFLTGTTVFAQTTSTGPSLSARSGGTSTTRSAPPATRPAQSAPSAGTGASLAGTAPGVNNGWHGYRMGTSRTAVGSPVTLWDNGAFNGVDGLASAENTGLPSSRTADDFVLTAPATLTQVTADLFADASMSYTGTLDIFATDASGNGPIQSGAPIVSVTSTNFQVVGNGFGLDIRRYTFTLPNTVLSSGRYWVNPYLTGTGSGLGYFCTSNGATPSAEQNGYFRSGGFGFPNWTDVSDSGLNFSSRDFAFTVVGTAAPAPATLLWDNGPFDGVNGLASMENTSLPSSRTADDFVLTTSATLTQVTADLYASPGLTFTGSLDLFATDASGIGPTQSGSPIVSVTSTNFQLVGSGFGFDIRRYTFDLPNTPLAAGRYWVNPYLVGPGSGAAYFCTSNGATPSAEQDGFFRSAGFGSPNWTNALNQGVGPHFAFTVTGNAGGGTPVAVNDQVSFVTTAGGVAGITGSCATAGYTNQYNLTVNLTNTGSNTFTNPYFQVLELQSAGGVVPSNPFRLQTADDFNSGNCTGGLVGANQAITATMTPGQTTAVNFQIAMPAFQRFRFMVGAYAVVSGGNARATSTTRKLGRIAIETTGFDKAGNPILSATFIPEKGAPALNIAGVKATLAK